MHKNLVGALVALGLFAGCNGKTDLTADDVLGFNPAEAKFAFFGSAEGFGTDLNDNGTNDAVGVLFIVLSDNPDFCKEFSNLGNLIDPKDQILISISASTIADNSEGPALDGDLTFDGNNVDNALEVAFSVTRAGDNVADANADDGEATLNIQGAGGDRFSAELNATLSFDDGAGNLLTSNLSGSFSAQRCQDLDSFALLGF